MTQHLNPQIRWYHKVLLLGASAVVFILLLEGAGRAIGVLPIKADAEYQSVSREVGRLHLPYSSFIYRGDYNGQVEFSVPVTLNKLGFRSEDPQKAAPGHSTRIVVLGDSFTADWQVSEDQMWSTWLSRQLQEKGVPNEVINLGHPGWGTAQEYLLYHVYASELSADMVILVIYVQNDVANNGLGLWSDYASFREQYTYFTLDDSGQLVEHLWPYVDITRPYLQQDFPSNAIGWLDKNSVIYRALRSVVHTIRGVKAAANPDTSSNSNPHTEHVQQRSNIPLEMQIMNSSPDAEWEQAWTITEKLLVRLRDEVTADGATFAAVIVPPHMIVEYDSWGWKLQFETSDYPLKLLYPHERMLSLLSTLDIPVLDPLQIFLDFKARAGESLFYQYDRHFNPTGTCLFGLTLSDWLADEGYVEGEVNSSSPLVCIGR